MKRFLCLALTIIMMLVLVGCGSSSSSYSSDDNGYSDAYNNDAEYRKNVGDIADAYGVSESEVDATINAIAGGN